MFPRLNGCMKKHRGWVAQVDRQVRRRSALDAEIFLPMATPST